MTDVDDEEDADLEEFLSLVEQVRVGVAAGEQSGLAATFTALWRRLNTPLFQLVYDLDEELDQLDALCDTAFPLPGEQHDQLAWAADILDAPWPTHKRALALEARLNIAPQRSETIPLDPLAEDALTAPASPDRTRLLHAMLRSRLGFLSRPVAARVLAALHELGELEAEDVESAFVDNHNVMTYNKPPLGDYVFGTEDQIGSDAFRSELRDAYDELLWRLTATVNPYDWYVTPTSTPPRGERFVQRGRDIAEGRVAAAPPSHDEAYVQKMADFLRSAEPLD